MAIWQTEAGYPIVNSEGLLIDCDDCPCTEPFTCTTFNAIASTLEVSVTIAGVTIGTTSGCTCSNVPLVGIVPYDPTTCFGQYWLPVSLGCSQCSGTTCYGHLVVFYSCLGDTFNVRAGLVVSQPTLDYCFGEDPDYRWEIEWFTTTSMSGYTLGSNIVLPYASYNSRSPIRCAPTGYTTSTATLSFTIA
jgi:hypothetical protein